MQYVISFCFNYFSLWKKNEKLFTSFIEFFPLASIIVVSDATRKWFWFKFLIPFLVIRFANKLFLRWNLFFNLSLFFLIHVFPNTIFVPPFKLQQLSGRHVLSVAGATTVAVAAVFATQNSSKPNVTFLSDDSAHPPAYPWRHRGFFAAYDCAALRRGFQVYREVCATCHSLKRIRWRELVGVTHTKEQVKAMAKEVDVLDGPNMEGEMYERPGKPYDPLPSPYMNINQGRAANGGAYPPDLSLMVKARHNGHDYIMALLTGYQDAPAGRELMVGNYYNPYFPGGGISMPPPLQDEGVEYPDGTIATISQQARDIAQFLNWTAEPEADERKKNASLNMLVLIFIALGAGYQKRYKWSPFKTRKISYLKDS
jgi:ubiquinol-cytochrome c reductase cytochrome c1 subunit